MSTSSQTPENGVADIQWRHPEAIVECDWLKDQIGNPSLRIYDCTTYLHYTDDHPSKPYDVGSGYAEYAKAHIPQSAYLDLQNDLSDQDSPYSFTLPTLTSLADRFQALGVGSPYHIVLYARNGLQWATRIWWMLYVLGYRKVSILNGGFAEWQRLGLPIEQASTVFAPADFTAEYKPGIFVGKDSVLAAIADPSSVLINALTEDIHVGDNPRYGRRGRIANSCNIPFHQLVDGESGKLIPAPQAWQVFKDKNIFPGQKIMNYCGGGIAATLDAFVLHQLGFPALFIYDNSMSEWAMDPELPMETG